MLMSMSLPVIWFSITGGLSTITGLTIFLVVSSIHFFDSWHIDSDGSCSSAMARRCDVVKALVNTGMS